MPDSIFRATSVSRYRHLIPRTSTVRSGVWLYASCKPFPLVANWLSSSLSRASSGLVPGRWIAWKPPLEPDHWTEWVDRSSELLRSSVETWSVLLPTDSRRARFNVLLLDRAGDPIGFAKFTKNPLRRLPVNFVEALSGSPPASFAFPEHVDAGTVQDWTYYLTTPVPQRPHWPARFTAAARHRVVSELQAVVMAQFTDRSWDEGTWPVHGDFGPWNVRTVKGEGLWLVDWEEATVGPRAADETYHEVTRCLIHSKSTTRCLRMTRRRLAPFYSASEIAAAADFWLMRHARPEPVEVTGLPPPDLAGGTARLLTVMKALRSGW